MIIGEFYNILKGKVTETISVLTDKIAELDIEERISDFKDSIVIVTSNGYVFFDSLVP